MVTKHSLPPWVGNLAAPVLIAAVVLFFWNSIFVYPLRMFVVFLHELSHGLAAIATGGSIHSIELTSDEGGLANTRGGSSFLILNAGYLGSLLWGVALLLLSVRQKWTRFLLLFLGILTVVVTVLYIRTLFGFLYGLVIGGAFVLAGRKLPADACGLIVRVLAVTSCLYAVWDISSDVLTRSVAGSDASQLARMTGIPAVLWGLVWIAAAVVLTGLALLRIARGAGGGRSAVLP